MKLSSWSLLGVLADGLKDQAALQVQVAADGKMDLVSDKHLVFDEEGAAAEFAVQANPGVYEWGGLPEKIKQDQRAAFEGEVGEVTKFKSLNQERCLSARSDENATLTFADCDDNSDQLLWRKRSDGSYESLAHPDYCPRAGDGIWCNVGYVGLGECPGFKTTSNGYGMLLQLMQDNRANLGTWMTNSYAGSVDPARKDNVTTVRGRSIFKRVDFGDRWERVAAAAAEPEPEPEPTTVAPVVTTTTRMPTTMPSTTAAPDYTSEDAEKAARKAARRKARKARKAARKASKASSGGSGGSQEN